MDAGGYPQGVDAVMLGIGSQPLPRVLQSVELKCVAVLLRERSLSRDMLVYLESERQAMLLVSTPDFPKCPNRRNDRLIRISQQVLCIRRIKPRNAKWAEAYNISPM